jgi:chromosome segregation ATPase
MSNAIGSGGLFWNKTNLNDDRVREELAALDAQIENGQLEQARTNYETNLADINGKREQFRRLQDRLTAARGAQNPNPELIGRWENELQKLIKELNVDMRSMDQVVSDAFSTAGAMVGQQSTGLRYDPSTYQDAQPGPGQSNPGNRAGVK